MMQKIDSFGSSDCVVLGDETLIPFEKFESLESLANYIFNKNKKDALIKLMEDRTRTIDIRDVIFHGPATIIFWADGDKTVVKCMDGDPFNYEMGIAMCTLKKLLGDTYVNYKKDIQQYLDNKNKEEVSSGKTSSSSDDRREEEGGQEKSES